MAVTRQIDARTIGRLYAESVKNLGIVRSVHVRETRDWLEVWVVTDPVELLDVEPLFDAGIALEDRFPEAGVLIQLANPIDYPAHFDMVRDVVPAQAHVVLSSP